MLGLCVGSPGCFGALYVDQAGLKLRDPLSPASFHWTAFGWEKNLDWVSPAARSLTCRRELSTPWFVGAGEVWLEGSQLWPKQVQWVL